MKNQLLNENEKIKGKSYWSIVLYQLKMNRVAMAGFYIILFLVLIALFAPLLANSKPIIMRYEGKLYFPAFKDYLNAFPIPSFIARPLSKTFIFRMPERLRGVDFKELKDKFKKGDWAIFPLVPYYYTDIDADKIKLKPCLQHPLGTDDTGRDVLSRMIHGTIISLSVGVVAVSIYVVIGIIIGSIAGYFGGWVDILISRIIEIFICFPTFFLIITIIAFLPRSIYNIMIVIGIINWTGVARLIRGEFLKIKNLDYVVAARAQGIPTKRIIFRHILPNAIAPVLVTATFGIAGAILLESGLSFLGFGVAPPTASWGEIVNQGRRYVSHGCWHLILFPGLAIFITVTAFNLLGEGIRDALDPQLRRAKL